MKNLFIDLQISQHVDYVDVCIQFSLNYTETNIVKEFIKVFEKRIVFGIND